MLVAFTCSMCVESWGRIGFSQALIEFSSDSDLKKEVIMTIPNELPNEEGTVYVKEVIRVEYEWKPPHCRRKKGKTGSTQHQQINGIKLSKPTPNFQYRPVPKSGKDMGDASNVGAKDQNEGATSQSSFAKTFFSLESNPRLWDSREYRPDDLELGLMNVDEVLFQKRISLEIQFDIQA
ncbi:hypothetical protein Tco_1508067 [Tanacetum coccineum]